MTVASVILVLILAGIGLNVWMYGSAYLEYRRNKKATEVE